MAKGRFRQNLCPKEDFTTTPKIKKPSVHPPKDSSTERQITPSLPRGECGDPGAYPPHAGSEMSAMYAAQMMQAHMMPPGQTRGGWIGAARGRSGPSARGPAAADGASGADGADAPRRLGVPRADGAVPAVPARRAGGARD